MIELVILDWKLAIDLMRKRNEIAVGVVKASSNDGTSGVVSTVNSNLPPMLHESFTCERCFQAAECMIYHAALENGNATSSGAPSLFKYVMKSNCNATGDNLNIIHTAYLRHFQNLLDIENNATTKASGTICNSTMQEQTQYSNMWSKLSIEREDKREACVGDLRLKDFPTNLAINVCAGNNDTNLIVLIGRLITADKEPRIAIGDHVFVSVEHLRKDVDCLEDLEDLCGKVRSNVRKSIGDLVFNQLTNVCSGSIVSISSIPCVGKGSSSLQTAYEVSINKGFDIFNSVVKQFKSGNSIGVQKSIIYPKANLSARNFADRLAFRLDKDNSLSNTPLLRYYVLLLFSYFIE